MDSMEYPQRPRLGHRFPNLHQPGRDCHHIFAHAPSHPFFAAGTFGLIYFAYLHNLLYVYDQTIDTGGMVFPRAIWQSFTGIYILEICMTGLFGIRGAYPQLVLFAITIPITAVYQIVLQGKIGGKLEFLDSKENDELGVGYGVDQVDQVSRPTNEKHSAILGRCLRWDEVGREIGCRYSRR